MDGRRRGGGERGDPFCLFYVVSYVLVVTKAESSSSRKPSVRQKFFGAPPRRETLLDVKAVQKRHTTTMISPLALQKAMQLAGLAQPDEQKKPDLSGIREEEEEEEEEEEDNTEEGMKNRLEYVCIIRLVSRRRGCGVGTVSSCGRLRG